MSTINGRINEILVKVYGGNILKFAKAVNIPKTTVRGLCGLDLNNGKPQDPKYSQLISILKATNVHRDWLLYNMGDMLSTPGGVDYINGNVRIVRDTSEYYDEDIIKNPTTSEDATGHNDANVDVAALLEEIKELKAQNDKLVESCHNLTATILALSQK